MLNRIDRLFKAKSQNIVSIYITAGFPQLNDTLNVLKALDKAEVDLVEVGIPFSDPLADGETIQRSSTIALENGMTLQLLFEQLKSLREISDKPVLIMGYLNSVLQFGIEEFYKNCRACGIDGVILPDLPLSEFEKRHKLFTDKYNIHPVFLISPLTDKKRIVQIDKLSKGFVYLVSSNSTTGKTEDPMKATEQSIKEIMKLKLKNKILIGFGINNAKTFDKACSMANGAIIGSEYIRRISNSSDIEKTTVEFIKEIKTSVYDHSIK